MKYKVGDKVKVTAHYGQKFGDIEMDEREACDAVGVITHVDDDEKYYDIAFDNESIMDSVCWTDEMLKPVEKTLDNLEVGDIVIDDLGNEQMVLATMNKLIFLSAKSHLDIAGEYMTTKELKDEQYTVKQPEQEVKEVTIDEVAEKFGVDVKKIKIKK